MSEQEPTDQKERVPDDVEPASPPKQREKQREPKPAPKSETKRKEASSSGFGSGAVLAIFISLVAIGVASYPAYLMWQETQNPAEVQTDVRVEGLIGDVAGLGNQVAGLSERQAELMSQSDAGQSATQAQLKALESRLASELEVMRDQFGTTSQDWLYAEVEYLIRMANQRALMEQDTEAALHLLTSADRIVRDAEGLTAHALREALALDIAALQAVNRPDVQGIFLKLSGLVSQVPNLKRNTPTYTTPESVDLNVAPPTGWLDRIQRLMTNAASRLSELVDFRRDDVEIRPILPPAEEYYLRQNLTMKLQMAQLALLEGDNAVFRSSVESAAVWVSDYFQPDDPAVVATSQSLAALAEADISTNVPDISRSLIAVRRQLDNFSGEAVR